MRFTLLSVLALGVWFLFGAQVVGAQYYSTPVNPTPSPSPSPVTQSPSPASPSTGPCMPEEGVWRPGSTYNDPWTLITLTAVDCCNICRADSRCITWSRSRVTGACALKDTAAEAFLDASYDSGVIEGTDAQSVVALGRCYSENGSVYPRGNVLMRTSTGSANACCEQCRNNSECFSWHRNERNGNCVLNRNVPARASGGNFVGASMI